MCGKLHEQQMSVPQTFFSRFCVSTIIEVIVENSLIFGILFKCSIRLCIAINLVYQHPYVTAPRKNLITLINHKISIISKHSR